MTVGDTVRPDDADGPLMRITAIVDDFLADVEWTDESGAMRHGSWFLGCLEKVD